jgi:S-adenosylmethionine:tRNA ribosyltransferase-isomerase
VKTELFDYELPEELIAVRPAERRDGARLLLLDGGRLEHRSISEWPELVPEGALVVLNDSRVRRARVLGARRPGGGRVELFLLKPLAREQGSDERWTALGRANKPLKPGTVIEAGELSAEVQERAADGLLTLVVRAPGGVENWLSQHGHVPIPPYLRRQDEAADLERYQTVYARRTSSVAAPTAGLHLTEELLRRLEARSIEIAKLELEVGLGTFLPVQVPDLDQHPMHAERIDVSPPLARSIADKRRAGAPIVAVGTTVVRALESAADAERPGQIRARAGETRLLIQPGYEFRVVDALLTNFHQPRSTLLALVSAFAGIESIKMAYGEAIRARYRFLSYGDAMWIARRAR